MVRDYVWVSERVCERLGLGVGWRRPVEWYVRYVMSMWGRGVRDCIGVRIEEGMDMRMDLRGYRDLCWKRSVYRYYFHRAIRFDLWGSYRFMIREGIDVVQERRRKYLSDLGFWRRNKCGRKSGFVNKKKVKYSVHELKKMRYDKASVK